MSAGPDLWIRWTTTGCVTRLPLISLRPAGPAHSSLRLFRWESSQVPVQDLMNSRSSPGFPVGYAANPKQERGGGGYLAGGIGG